MKKKILGILTIFVLCLGFSSLTVLADEGGYTIKDYKVDAVLRKDNTIKVHEVIKVNFRERRHGIYRYIQDEWSIKRDVSRSQDANKDKYKEMRYVCDVSDISTGNDDYEVEQDGDNCVIRIGDEDTKIIGDKVYDIYYTYKMPDDRVEYTDFIFYSVLGAGWETTIDHFSFKIKFDKTLPEDVPEKMKVYSGAIGETSNTMNVDWNCDRDGIEGNARNIGPNNAITIFANLPEGYFEGEMHTDSTLPITLMIVFAVCAMITLVITILRKDEKPVEVVEFYPPDGITSAQIGYIVDGKVDNEDIISMLPMWAKSGYIRIVDDGEKTVLEKIKDLPDAAPQFEKDLFRAFFRASERKQGVFDMSEEINEGFIDDFNMAKGALKLEFIGEKKLFNYNIIGLVLGIVSVVMLFLSIATSSVVSVFDNVILAAVIGVVAIVVWIIRWFDSSKVYVTSKPKKILNTAILIIPVAICALALILIDWEDNFLSCSIVVGAVIIQLIIGYFSGLLRTSTKYRKEILGRILGFKQFIITAELDQLKMLMDENPEYFYDVLPYAMVFGLEEKWGKKFEGLLLTQPDWYVGPHYHMFWPMHFNREITMKVNTAIAQSVAKTATTTAGGFSGGGSVGGGGGSW